MLGVNSLYPLYVEHHPIIQYYRITAQSGIIAIMTGVEQVLYFASKITADIPSKAIVYYRFITRTINISMTVVKIIPLSLEVFYANTPLKGNNLTILKSHIIY